MLCRCCRLFLGFRSNNNEALERVFPELAFDKYEVGESPSENTQFWDFYLETRILHQLNFAKKMLTSEVNFFQLFKVWSLGPKAQLVFLRAVWQLSLAVGILLHLIAVVFLAQGSSGAVTHLIQCFSFLLFFTSVASDALLRGFLSENDTTRYAVYASKLEQLRWEFDKAKSITDNKLKQEKLYRVALEVECSPP
jgi:hypothetical protein